MGCHGGLNVPDTLGGSGGRYLDWAQLYSTKQVAMYIANTGFGYGDTRVGRALGAAAVDLRQEPALGLQLGG